MRRLHQPRSALVIYFVSYRLLLSGLSTAAVTACINPAASAFDFILFYIRWVLTLVSPLRTNITIQLLKIAPSLFMFRVFHCLVKHRLLDFGLFSWCKQALQLNSIMSTWILPFRFRRQRSHTFTPDFSLSTRVQTVRSPLWPSSTFEPSWTPRLYILATQTNL